MLRETLKQDQQRAARAITATLAAAIVALGAAYTAVHNYNLFARYLPSSQQIFALIPVIALEGSLLLLLVAQFTWLVAPAQRIIAAAASWLLFGLLAIHTLIDSWIQAGSQPPDWLALYANFALPITPVLTTAIWKLIIDADPARARARARATLESAIEQARYEATMAALDRTEITAAIQAHTDAVAQAAAQRIITTAPGSGSASPKITTPRPKASPAMNGVVSAQAGHSGE
jgi:hypothetical protein